MVGWLNPLVGLTTSDNGADLDVMSAIFKPDFKRFAIRDGRGEFRETDAVPTGTTQ